MWSIWFLQGVSMWKTVILYIESNYWLGEALEVKKELLAPSEIETSPSLWVIVVSSVAESWAFKRLLLVFCCWSNIFFSCLPCSSILNCNFLWTCTTRVSYMKTWSEERVLKESKYRPSHSLVLASNSSKYVPNFYPHFSTW